MAVPETATNRHKAAALIGWVIKQNNLRSMIERNVFMCLSWAEEPADREWRGGSDLSNQIRELATIAPVAETCNVISAPMSSG